MIQAKEPLRCGIEHLGWRVFVEFVRIEKHRACAPYLAAHNGTNRLCAIAEVLEGNQRV